MSKHTGEWGEYDALVHTHMEGWDFDDTTISLETSILLEKLTAVFDRTWNYVLSLNDETLEKKRGRERLARLEDFKMYVTPWLLSGREYLAYQTCLLRFMGDYPNWEMERRPLHQDGWGDLIARHVYLQTKENERLRVQKGQFELKMYIEYIERIHRNDF
jgi:hypothetical protein